MPLTQDDLPMLKELRRQGKLSEEHYIYAVAALQAEELHVERGELTPNELAKRALYRQHVERELAQLDEWWLTERQRHCLGGKGGGFHPATYPLASLTLLVPLVLGGGCIAHGVVAASLAFQLLGMAVVMLGALASLHFFHRAGQYRHAYRDYLLRRALCLSGQPVKNAGQQKLTLQIQSALPPR
jgi:hypothetical protein